MKRKRDYHFVFESSNKYKLKVFFITLIAIIILVGFTIASITIFRDRIYQMQSFQTVKDVIYTEIKSATPTGLFYSGLFGGLFFIPLPHEIVFYYGLTKGNPVFFSFIMILSGYLFSQAFNYYFGSKFSNLFLNLISKKKIYKIRRYVNKRGALGIFLFNLLFLPAPILTFALGLTRYNVYRLLFYTILGNILKFSLIVLFYLLITHY